jgi:Ca2+-binding RTX toxin-like protein
VIFNGNNANNTIVGTTSPDTIFGNGGNDELYGHELHDQYDGLTSDRDLLYGGVGNDKLEGGLGNDTLFAGDGNDQAYGGSNNDTLYGGNGNDITHGDSGNDTCYGGLGEDNVRGGKGVDQLFGGAGDDRFFFKILTDGVPNSAVDTIRDFDTAGNGHDRIDVSNLDANVNTPDDQAFHFIDGQPLSSAGQLHVVLHSGFALVEASVDSDAEPEFQIKVTNLSHDFVASDFIL